jgi:hypothetical protein
LDLAAHFYKLAADQNVALAQYNYGMRLYNRRGVFIDQSLAAKFLKLAAAQGLALAQYFFACCLEFGLGVDVDLPEASELYTRAAEQSDVREMNNLGLCFEMIGVSVEICPTPLDGTKQLPIKVTLLLKVLMNSVSSTDSVSTETCLQLLHIAKRRLIKSLIEVHVSMHFAYTMDSVSTKIWVKGHSIMNLPQMLAGVLSERIHFDVSGLRT